MDKIATEWMVERELKDTIVFLGATEWMFGEVQRLGMFGEVHIWCVCVGSIVE